MELQLKLNTLKASDSSLFIYISSSVSGADLIK